MKQTMILAALVAAFAGCTSSTSIKWGGKKAVRDADGTVLTAADGSPYYESEPNIYDDFNWLTKREERDVKVDVQSDGAYTASLGSRVNALASILFVTAVISSV